MSTGPGWENADLLVLYGIGDAGAWEDTLTLVLALHIQDVWTRLRIDRSGMSLDGSKEEW